MARKSERKFNLEEKKEKRKKKERKLNDVFIDFFSILLLDEQHSQRKHFIEFVSQR